MSQILVFGDSVAYGSLDRKGGWAYRLRKKIDKKVIDSGMRFYCVIYNLSIDGDNTKGLLKRFEREVKIRLLEDETIILFAIGGNDSCFIKNKNNFITPAAEFKKNIIKLIDLAKKYSKKIIFIGDNPINERKTSPVFWDENMYYKNEHLERYNKIVKSVCKENKVGFIEIFEEFMKTDYKKLLEDGLHPNSKGHEKIFKIVKACLLKNNLLGNQVSK